MRNKIVSGGLACGLFLLSGVAGATSTVFEQAPAVYSPPPLNAPAPVRAPSPFMVNTENPENWFTMKGKWGIGTDFSSFTIRHWVTNKLALEWGMGGSTGTYNGFDFDRNETTDNYWSANTGLGMKYAFARPADILMAEAVMRVSYERYFMLRRDTDKKIKENSQGGVLSLGIAFETFVPFFHALSLESFIGVVGRIIRTEEDYVVNPVYVGWDWRYPGEKGTKVHDNYSVAFSRSNLSLWSVINASLTCYF
jgi:hypothetical protein